MKHFNIKYLVIGIHDDTKSYIFDMKSIKIFYKNNDISMYVPIYVNTYKFIYDEILLGHSYCIKSKENTHIKTKELERKFSRKYYAPKKTSHH